MKYGGIFSVFSILFFSLTLHAVAQSPHVQLQQMIEQLQKAPDDNALREQIIRFAPTLNPAPVVPDTANHIRRTGAVRIPERHDGG